MTNETTASQPKSIEDDALLPCPFCGNENPELEDHRLLWCVSCTCGTTVLGDKAPEPGGHEPKFYWDSIKNSAIGRWNSRAPAAQASAAIQAAPMLAFSLYTAVNNMVAHIGMCGEIDARHGLVAKVMDELHKLDGGNVAQRVDDLVEKAFMPKDQATKLAVEEYCYKADAATIQEPVMVAEPDEEGWPTNAMISAGFKAGLSGKIGSGFRAMQAAAPMVADPAGVEKSAAERKHAERIENMHSGVVGVFAAIKADHLAATVKAVPSEALEAGRKRALHAAVSAIWFEDRSDYLKTIWEVVNALAPELIEELQSDAQAVYIKTMPDAAPLADKTGGGE